MPAKTLSLRAHILGPQTRAARQCYRWQMSIERDWPAYGTGGTSTTFTLKRIVNSGARDDLGIPPRGWNTILTDRPCIYQLLPGNDARWKVQEEGQVQSERLVMHTAYEDIREGDEVVLAADGKTYLVEASEPVGCSRRCVLTSGRGRSG